MLLLHFMYCLNAFYALCTALWISLNDECLTSLKRPRRRVSFFLFFIIAAELLIYKVLMLTNSWINWHIQFEYWMNRKSKQPCMSYIYIRGTITNNCFSWLINQLSWQFFILSMKRQKLIKNACKGFLLKVMWSA